MSVIKRLVGLVGLGWVNKLLAAWRLNKKLKKLARSNFTVTLDSDSDIKEDVKLYKYAFFFDPKDFDHIGMEKFLNEVIGGYRNMLLDLDPIIGNSWEFLNDVLTLNGVTPVSINELPKNSNDKILGNYRLLSEKIYPYFGQKDEWFFEHDEKGHIIEVDDKKTEAWDFNHLVKVNSDIVCVEFKSPKQLRYEGIDEISANAGESDTLPLVSGNFAVNYFDHKNGMFKDWTFDLFEEGDGKKIDIILYNFEIKRYYQVELSYAKVGRIAYWDDFLENTSMDNFY